MDEREKINVTRNGSLYKTTVFFFLFFQRREPSELHFGAEWSHREGVGSGSDGLEVKTWSCHF